MPETEACLSHMSTLTCACEGRDDVGAFGRASRPHRSLQSGPPSGPVARPECVAQPGGLESQPDGGQGYSALWHRPERRCCTLDTAGVP